MRLLSLLCAAQVWDDKSLLNVDFSLICSNYSLKDINQLEKQVSSLSLRARARGC